MASKQSCRKAGKNENGDEKNKSKIAEMKIEVEEKKKKTKTGAGSSTKPEDWTGIPLSEYVVPGPIPDLNQIASFPNLNPRIYLKDVKNKNKNKK